MREMRFCAACEIRRIALRSGYRPVTAEAFRGYAAPQSAEDDAALPPEVMLSTAFSPTARILKDRPKIRAVCADGRFFKEYRIRGGWKIFRYLFRIPRPFRVLTAALRLKTAGIDTPEVLLALRGTVRGGKRSDWLVTAELSPDAVFADRMVREGGLPAAKAFLDGFIPVAAAMHAAGIEHGDLNLRNICRNAPPEPARWGVIDLDGARLGGTPVSIRRRCREVARLATSLRFALAPEARERLPWEEFLEDCADRYGKAAGMALPRRTLRSAVRRFFAHRATGERIS